MQIRQVDRTGERFGRLVIVGRSAKKRQKNAFFWCQCDCGDLHLARWSSLKSGSTKSCGCLRRERNKENPVSHGKSDTNTFRVWANMISRCKYPYFQHHYGKGIGVCERWQKFENFLADMGERPDGMTLDRINNLLGYYPENCRWATQKLQSQNRNAKGYTFDKKQGKWVAQIKRDGIHIQIGKYDSPEEAHQAYIAKRKELDQGRNCDEDHA